MSDSSFVNPNNTQARGDDTYKNIIDKIKEDKVCPFCPEQLALYHKNPIITENDTWLLTKNMYPYKGAKHHFLLIHKKHISSPEELSADAKKDLFDIILWTNRELKIPGGTFFMRYGDTRYTGASVAHLHAQLVSSDPTQEGYEPVLARIG
ncbi:hypothetical protein H0W32_00360 [Patescibacteria group bacterium]|nr:hypothetical protein [Patescibacteria group bacterium]